MTRLERNVLIGLAAIAYLVAFALTAKADVRVAITPTTRSVDVASPAAYTITATSDEPVILADVYGMLPGHGQPCGQPDEPGQPYGGDPDTQFTVLTPGALTTGRWVTFPGPFNVTPDEPLNLELDVLTPSIAACFYAGATADPTPDYADAQVNSTAQGGELDVNQTGLTTFGWFYTATYPNVQLEWDIENDTDHPIDIASERLGLPAGFTYVSSRYLGDPKIRSVKSFSAVWNMHSTIPPHTDETVYVNLVAPCAPQRTIHARLRVTTSANTAIGTGNTGPALQLEPCS